MLYAIHYTFVFVYILPIHITGHSEQFVLDYSCFINSQAFYQPVTMTEITYL